MIAGKKEIEVLRRILFAAPIPLLTVLRESFHEQLRGELQLGCELDQEAVDYLDWLIRRQELL